MSDVLVIRRESVVTIVQGEENSPIVTERETPTVVIQREGIPGPRGPTGPTGTVGSTFLYTPPDVALVWTIAHNLQRKPIITVLDSADRIIYPNVTYLNDNLVQLEFDVPMTGTARLN